MSFLFINKILRLNNLKTKTALNTKIPVFVICVEAIIHMSLSNLHDCTFKRYILIRQFKFLRWESIFVLGHTKLSIESQQLFFSFRIKYTKTITIFEFWQLNNTVRQISPIVSKIHITKKVADWKKAIYQNNPILRVDLTVNFLIKRFPCFPFRLLLK